ncbi:hypothetical protein [Serratia marcescens]|uniref:hypothetical protein n=1 Tax=Serratia marcescens TaxID=615 RepID=UPI00076178CE|nr:hypothetical protein [Serratia marcescens]
MNAPFFAAANRVIRMYELRQEMANSRHPAHSPQEIHWGSEMLRLLAGAAGYAGSDEAIRLYEAVDHWRNHEKVPAFFPEDIEV